MQQAYIINGVRTAIGNFGGSLSTIRTDDLATFVLKELMNKNPQVDWTKVVDVIMGCANQAGEDNRNVARMASLMAGLPITVPGQTINRLCASGLAATVDAARYIQTGDADLMIASGVENMTRGPLVMSKASSPFGRDQQLFDTSFGWRFINPKLKELFGVDAMGETAENVAELHHINRIDQDNFALWSQQKAAKAIASGRFEKEIVPIEIPQKKGDAIIFKTDEFAKPTTTIEGLTKLKASFRKEGTVTAGNASGLNDGAAVVMLMSAQKANELGLKPLAKIRAYSSAGIDPSIMGMGPVSASQLCLKKAGWTHNDLDLMEINEAFAAQAIAVNKEMGWDTNKINVNGGAIAIGHPIGASGCRILVTLLHEMIRRDAKRGLASLCIGGGMGVALAIER